MTVASPDKTATSASTPTHWLGWSAFLGASWTWCIGMFLPVLLVRDYGIWGWVVFAIPNVVGAAAMGWTIRSAVQSRQMAQTHRNACQLFSAVTIAFHLFFALSVIAPMSEDILRNSETIDLALGGILAGSALMYVYITRRADGDRTLAITILLISLTAMVLTAREIHSIALTSPELLRPISMQFSTDLLWLAPVCVFGFFACPYLDLTFHRARQHAGSPRMSFGVGFGGWFAAMIVFSLIYSRAFKSGGLPAAWIAIFLFVHMALQSAFTIAAHARELRDAGGWVVGVAAALTLAAGAGYWFLPHIRDHYLPGEVIYRCFMGFYGLAFPAYVWLIMLPSRGTARMTWINLAVYAAVVLAAAPAFFLGFVWQRMVWLGPGLGIVLLARLLTNFQSPAELAK